MFTVTGFHFTKYLVRLNRLKNVAVRSNLIILLHATEINTVGTYLPTSEIIGRRRESATTWLSQTIHENTGRVTFSALHY